jgi:hypothetical protein
MSVETRIEKLEGYLGNNEVQAVGILREVTGKNGAWLVKIAHPISRRGEEMTVEKFHLEFPKGVVIRVTRDS